MSNDKVERKIERPFTIVYNDFIDNSGVLSSCEKLVMLVLMRYGEKAFPSVPKIAKSIGATDRTVQKTIKSLIEKGIVKREYRFSEKGDHTTNVYTIIDSAAVWAAKSEEEMKAAAEETELERAMRIIKEHGGTVNFPGNAKLLTSDTGISEASNSKNSLNDNKNDTVKSEKSQEPEQTTFDKKEQYPMDFIHNYFGYDSIRAMHHAHDDNVDSVFSVLYDALNTKGAYIRIGQEDKPAEVVKGKLLKLDHECIEYTIQKFKEQTDRIQAPIPWILAVLYKSREQFDLDITNQVNHDMWT